MENQPCRATMFFPWFCATPGQVEYVTICVVTALVTFVFWPILSRVSVLSHMGTGMDGWLSQAIDTIGLASFAVAGTQHGIRRAAHPGITIVICCITCSGGGILRDVGHTPMDGFVFSNFRCFSRHGTMYVERVFCYANAAAWCCYHLNCFGAFVLGAKYASRTRKPEGQIMFTHWPYVRRKSWKRAAT